MSITTKLPSRPSPRWPLQKEESKMKDQTEAKLAWILWELFTDFNDLLWRRYEQQFLDFILNEQYPTQKSKQKLMADQIDHEVPL
jgi:hypothetical protein